ncbi:acyltransferase family protein [Maribacter sp. Asnod1-A12]|uniref:acyltransferase family protein n=1 Tax=Maribacter sp. Asnod1-A12 TaxID=3160576 RepID=UPI00386357F5
MKNLNWPKRLYALDISRAFASIAVILWHWQHFYYNGTLLDQNFDRVSQPFYSFLRIFYEQGGRGIQFFFLLSGFVFFWIYYDAVKTKRVSIKDFFLARFSRLYPLHFLTLMIVLFLQLLYFSREGTYFVYEFNDLYHFILNLFFASQWGIEQGWSFNGPVWSVSIEILLYFIFFIVAVKKIGNFFFCISISLLAFVVSSFFSDHSIFVGLTSFFFGGVLYQFIRLMTSKYFRYNYLIYVVCAVSWILVITNIYLVEFSENLIAYGFLGKSVVVMFPIYILFPSTVASLAIFEISSYHSSSKVIGSLKSLSWIGDITYSSYLLHFPLQLLAVYAVSYGILEDRFYLTRWFFILFFVLLLPLSYVTFLKFEKPMQRWIRKKFDVKRKNSSILK